MNRQSLGRPLFAAGMIGLGVLSLVYRNILMWFPVPGWMPAPTLLAILSGLFLILAGAGLLSGQLRPRAARALLLYFIVIDLLLVVPPLVASPLLELAWLEIGMFTAVVLAAWLLTGKGGLSSRALRLILGVSLIPVGLSHFFYLQITVDLVPHWLPARTAWAYLTGASHLAAGLGLCFGVYPRLAAMLEAGMLMAFTIIVWVPKVITSPGVHFNWTEILASWVIAAAVWVAADALGGMPWLSVGKEGA